MESASYLKGTTHCVFLLKGMTPEGRFAISRHPQFREGASDAMTHIAPRDYFRNAKS
jgi:hypothetical protein